MDENFDSVIIDNEFVDILENESNTISDQSTLSDNTDFNTNVNDTIIIDNSLVEWISNRNIMTTSIEDYTIVESLLLIIVFLSLVKMLFK